MAMKTLEELTSQTSVSSWIPSEAYADFILDASVCYGQLSGKVTAVEYDVAAGMGKTVKIRMVPPRAAQSPIIGGCLSDVSNVFNVASITIGQIADYDYLWEFALWESKGPVKEKIMNEMAKALAKKRDQNLYACLTGVGVAGYNSTSIAWGGGSRVTLNVTCASAVSDGAQTGGMKIVRSVFNSVASAIGTLKGRGMNPDTVILHPSVAKYFYYRDYTSNPYIYGAVKFDGSKLSEIAGVKVVECCNANTCSNTSGASVVFVLDSSRALAEAWGMRPAFYEQFIPDCNKTKLTTWSYWGCSVVSVGAIVSIVNP